MAKDVLAGGLLLAYDEREPEPIVVPRSGDRGFYAMGFAGDTELGEKSGNMPPWPPVEQEPAPFKLKR
jgi:hypothetical protein